MHTRWVVVSCKTPMRAVPAKSFVSTRTQVLRAGLSQSELPRSLLSQHFVKPHAQSLTFRHFNAPSHNEIRHRRTYSPVQLPAPTSHLCLLDERQVVHPVSTETFGKHFLAPTSNIQSQKLSHHKESIQIIANVQVWTFKSIQKVISLVSILYKTPHITFHNVLRCQELHLHIRCWPHLWCHR